MSSAALAPVLPRVVGTHVAAPQDGTLQRLNGVIDAALVRPDGVPVTAEVSQRPAPADQVLTVVLWTVGYDLPDARTRLRVRTDARTILQLVRTSVLHYGSVLLLATGGVMRNGKKTVAIVLRAKFTKDLVRRTNWAVVSPGRVLGMADDQVAVVAAGYH